MHSGLAHVVLLALVNTWTIRAIDRKAIGWTLETEEQIAEALKSQVKQRHSDEWFKNHSEEKEEIMAMYCGHDGCKGSYWKPCIDRWPAVSECASCDWDMLG